MFLIGDVFAFAEYLNGALSLRDFLLALAAPVVLSLILFGRWAVTISLVALFSAPVYLLGLLMSLIDRIRDGKKS